MARWRERSERADQSVLIEDSHQFATAQGRILLEVVCPAKTATVSDGAVNYPEIKLARDYIQVVDSSESQSHVGLL